VSIPVWIDEVWRPSATPGDVVVVRAAGWGRRVNTETLHTHAGAIRTLGRFWPWLAGQICPGWDRTASITFFEMYPRRVNVPDHVIHIPVARGCDHISGDAQGLGDIRHDVISLEKVVFILEYSLNVTIDDLAAGAAEILLEVVDRALRKNVYWLRVRFWRWRDIVRALVHRLCRRCVPPPSVPVVEIPVWANGETVGDGWPIYVTAAYGGDMWNE